jgi:HAD superfamily hydrolase (TIGR01459 family)
MSNEPQLIEGLAEIIEAHDLFLVDQYGVLHDGRKLYPGVLDALRAIKAAGKQCLILTNSGRRAAQNVERLLKIGLPRDSFDLVVSSGEVAWHALDKGRLGAPFVRGAKVHVVGLKGDDYGLSGLDLQFTDDPAAAELVLILGSNAPATSLAEYRKFLAPAARAGVPALSSNPDKFMHTPKGLQPAPGAIAEIYEDLGGRVQYIGKPYADIYHYALGLVPAVPKDRILAIGDSVEHDIAGAARMGLNSLLIRCGILVEVDGAGLENLYTEYKAWPTYVMGKLAL